MNGVKVGEDCTLRPHDEVAYYLTPAQEAKKVFSPVFSDENVTVLDKESGVSAEAIFSALKEERETYFIHRLDRNTEGLMIFGHTMSASEALLSAFREKKVEKIYHALVFGDPAPHARLVAYLEKDAASSRVRVNNLGRGERIVTEYDLLERRGELSLLKVTLHTGKTHQIRAHLAFAGLPVAGDQKYGDFQKNRALHMTRQRLLSKQLTLHAGGALAYLDGKSFVSQKNL